MIKKFGLTFGGLQQKILNLVLIVILLIVGAFVAASLYLSANLTNVVQESAVKQKESMTSISGWKRRLRTAFSHRHAET